MNRIPVVTLTRTAGGWSLACRRCDWDGFELTRPDADIEARDHQTTCAKKGHHH